MRNRVMKSPQIGGSAYSSREELSTSTSDSFYRKGKWDSDGGEYVLVRSLKSMAQILARC